MPDNPAPAPAERAPAPAPSRRRPLLLALAALTIIAGGAGAGLLIGAQSASEPTTAAVADTSSDAPGALPAAERPPWVRADGSADLSKMPDWIPQLAVDGEIVRDRRGRVVRVPFGLLARGEMSEDEGRRYYARAERLQLQDALRRGLVVRVPKVTEASPPGIAP